MARLGKHGTELLRTERERTYDPDAHSFLKDGTDLGPNLTTWECQTRAYMADGTILEKHDVRFKPDTMDPKGRFYSYGWKLFGKMKPDHNIRDLVVKTQEIIGRGKTSWKIVNGGTPPVVISTRRIMAAIESGENAGFCKACGAEAYGVEPDARNYICESCGKPEVYGAEEMLISA